MKVKIFAPSYNRPEKSITQIKYPEVKLVVRESEAEEYISNGNDIVICPDTAQGNVSRIRNWILDNLYGDADCIIIVDDDCKYVGRWSKQEKYKFNQEELLEFSESSSVLCKELGYKHWGVNCVTDKGAYMEHTPLGFLQYIGSPFSAHLKESQIRYDEDLPLKEDYDMTLQHIQKYGGSLRFNFAHYDVKQAEQSGGCASMRNMQKEKQQFFALQNKWGKDIVVRDKKSKRSFDFNPILKIPKGL